MPEQTITEPPVRRGPARPPPGRAAMVTRFTFFRRTLLLAFYPVLTVAAGNAILLGLAPAREALGAFRGAPGIQDDDLWANPSYWIFIAALAYWSLTAWYCARLLVNRRFPIDNLGKCASRAFARELNAWTPRVLGLASCAPITVWFALPGAPPGAWIAPLLYTLGFTVLVVLRRPIVNRLAGHELVAPRPFMRSVTTARASLVAIGLMFGVSALVLAAVVLGREDAARALGAPALLLFAFGSWTVFGSIVLVYLPRSRGWPALTLLPLFCALLAAPFNENHVVAAGGGAAALADRPQLKDDFAAWQKARGAHAGEPVYLVAAAGGASRAAFWTGSLLLELERLARSHGRRFSQNIYAMSGVSGGSLGLAAFTGSLLAPGPDYGATSAQVEAFLGQDFLAPMVGYLLYPDLLARFAPIPCRACDRSLALEGAWARDWDRHVPQAAGWFGRPLAHLRQAQPLPHLLLNATSASEGRRVLQSTLAFLPPQALDLLDPSLAAGGLSLAQAVHNSARFPYVSPAALVMTAQGRPWDYLVDGGYFENSGAATLNAMIPELLKTGLVRLEQIVVLVIENEPAHRWQWICPAMPAREQQRQEAAAVPRTLSVGPSLPFGPPRRPDDKHVPAMPELSLPAYTLYQTRNARAQAAEEETTRLLGGCEGGAGRGQVVELRYPWLAEGRQPPLSWFLNRGTTASMAAMLQREQGGPPEVDAFLHNWQRIRRIVAGAPR